MPLFVPNKLCGNGIIPNWCCYIALAILNQIFSDGVISLQTPFFSHTGAQPFSQDFIQANNPILAPLWATLLSLREPNAHVFYRLSNDSDILDRVVEEITALNSDFSTS